jgi:hypothetical protein
LVEPALDLSDRNETSSSDASDGEGRENLGEEEGSRNAKCDRSFVRTQREADDILAARLGLGSGD